MASAWSTAQTIQAFLGAAEAKVPPEQRSPGFTAWLEWAQQYVEAIDPLVRPERIAKRLDPDPPKVGLLFGASK